MSDVKDSEPPPAEAPLHGLLAEYDSTKALIAASKQVRDAGYTRWDTYTPFPVHGIDRAMGIKMTALPWIVLCFGLSGLAFAIWLQWWTNAVDYAWIVSGKPFWTVPANVPIMFELTVLFSAFAALGGMLMLNRLPHPSHPLDLKQRFARSTNDKFFLLIQASDPKFDDADTRALLDSTGPAVLEDVPEDRVTQNSLPGSLVYGTIIFVVVSLIPFALFAKARETRSANRRIHAIWDMDFQPRYKPQRMNPAFPDQRAMRPAVPGTVPVGQLREDSHFYRGKDEAGDWALTLPEQVPPTTATMARGRERFGIYCAPCHGLSGKGDGIINHRADTLPAAAKQGWVPPANLHQDRLRTMPVGEIFNTITNGIRTMPPYGDQVDPQDRWAIIMYIRALQRSRATSKLDVPPAEQASLK